MVLGERIVPGLDSGDGSAKEVEGLSRIFDLVCCFRWMCLCDRGFDLVISTLETLRLFVPSELQFVRTNCPSRLWSIGTDRSHNYAFRNMKFDNSTRCRPYNDGMLQIDVLHMPSLYVFSISYYITVRSLST